MTPDQSAARAAGMDDPVEGGLLLEERRRRICDLLREHGRVTVEDLSRVGMSASRIVSASLLSSGSARR